MNKIKINIYYLNKQVINLIKKIINFIIKLTIYIYLILLFF